MILTSEQVSLLEEFKRRQEHVINKYVPSQIDGHNQLSYHKSNARYRLLFGGNQSGKSHAAAYDCAVNARGRNIFNPKCNITGRDVEIWVISAAYMTIKTGIYRHLKNIIPDWDIHSIGPKIPGHDIPTYLKIKRDDKNPQGDPYLTTITFMSAAGEDRGKFQAAAIDFFYIDEEIQADIWEELESRTLATGGWFSISATLVESYEWITELELQAERGNINYFLTRLNTELNPYLNKERVAELKAKWSFETLEYRFYGKSRRLTGLIYNTWDNTRHIVKPFDIPLDWPRWCAIDPGIRVCAALWVAVDPNNKAYAYRELYATNEPIWQIALTIKQLEGWELDKDLTDEFKHYVFKETPRSEHLVVRLIDPKSRARSEAGEESIISQLYTRYGLICTPADNNLRPGIEDVRWWLEHGFHIFDILENFQEERRCYRPRKPTKNRDQNDPIEDPIRRKNHLMDCVRYIAREKPIWNDRIRSPNYNSDQKILTTSDRIKIKKEREAYSNEYLGSNW